MKKTSGILPVLLCAVMGCGTMAVMPAVQASTQHIVIDNGDNALTKEEARERQQQWDETRSLRQKVNRRVEKEFDKADNAFDTRDKCEQSANLNAYWEPNTLRCLDRRTGRPVTP